MGMATRLGGLLAGGCVVCAAATSDGLLCAGCSLRLERTRPLRGAPPAGIDLVLSAAEHRDVARQLVAAESTRLAGDVAAAGVMATRMAALMTGEGSWSAAGAQPPVLVPVPVAPWRGRWRGFNPAREIATALAKEVEGGVADCLVRSGEGRQVGRRRGARRAAEFEIAAKGPVPRRCLLVDDVLTTGSTATACAVALRRAGADEVGLVTFTRSP
jgi:predicted amidophosphoribosyltransferase